MTQDRFTKVLVSQESTWKLRSLKGWTGLTPNILSRIALTLSLREPGWPEPDAYSTDGMEFNAYTLFGPYEVLTVALLIERLIQDGREPEGMLQEQLRAHINRGVALLYPRVRSLADLADLLPLDIVSPQG